MGRRLVLGDVHGNIKALEKVLELSHFTADDRLYFLGDISDRGSHSVECLRLLRSLPNMHAVTGNHDIWLRDYLLSGLPSYHWISKCGGEETIESFEKCRVSDYEKKELGDWISTWPAVILLPDSIIVHGGMPPGTTYEMLEAYSEDTTPVPVNYSDERNKLVWNRSYVYAAFDKPLIPPFETSSQIYIGHTPIGRSVRHSASYHLYALDTGSGYEGGLLTLMDIDSKECWQA